MICFIYCCLKCVFIQLYVHRSYLVFFKFIFLFIEENEIKEQAKKKEKQKEKKKRKNAAKLAEVSPKDVIENGLVSEVETYTPESAELNEHNIKNNMQSTVGGKCNYIFFYLLLLENCNNN